MTDLIARLENAIEGGRELDYEIWDLLGKHDTVDPQTRAYLEAAWTGEGKEGEPR